MQNYWKKTFENKQFHLYRYCSVGQHPSLNFVRVQMSILFTLNAADLHLLRKRLDQANLVSATLKVFECLRPFQ